MALGAVQEHLQKEPGFVGVSINQPAGGVAVITGTADFKVSSALVAPWLPAGTEIRILRVEHSLAQLTSLMRQISDDADLLRRQGILVDSVRIKNDVGLVEVTLDSKSSADAEKLIKSRYDESAISVVSGGTGYSVGASRSATTGRLYGGQYLGHHDGDYINNCTAGIFGAGFGYYNITAGHCGNHLNTRRGGYNTPDTGWIGQANSFYSHLNGETTCDCQGVGPIPASIATNQVIVENGALFSYTSLPPSSGYTQGRNICASGFKYALKKGNDRISCGPILNGSTYRQRVDGFDPGTYILLTDGVTIAAASFEGDSGAPLGSGSQFMGVLSGGNYANQPEGQSTQIIFSKSLRVQSNVGVTPIFSNP